MGVFREDGTVFRENVARATVYPVDDLFQTDHQPLPQSGGGAFKPSYQTLDSWSVGVLPLSRRRSIPRQWVGIYRLPSRR